LRRQKEDIKAVTVEEYMKGGGKRGGGPPEREPGLWELFNDTVSDISAGLRKKARAIIREKLESPQYTKEQKHTLHTHFNDIVDGGLKGALRAVSTIITNTRSFERQIS
jgi:hypothetical protein